MAHFGKIVKNHIRKCFWKWEENSLFWWFICLPYVPNWPYLSPLCAPYFDYCMNIKSCSSEKSKNHCSFQTIADKFRYRILFLPPSLTMPPISFILWWWQLTEKHMKTSSSFSFELFVSFRSWSYAGAT